jgi:hypothetical protein
MSEINNSSKELFDNLLEIIRFHSENNEVTYSEAIGLISILRVQSIAQDVLFSKEEDFKGSFTRETKELYFVLMATIESENLPELVGTLDLLHDFLIQEYHHELDIEFPPNDGFEDDDEDYDDFEDDDEDDF